MTLTGLYKRKRFQDKETGNRFINELAARMEFRPVTHERLRQVVDPAGQPGGQADLQGARADAAALGRRALHRGRRSRQEGARRGRAHHDEAKENIELFRPFILENAYVLRADNIRALRDRMPPEDQQLAAPGRPRRSTGTTTG